MLSEDHTIAVDGAFHDLIADDELLLRVNLIHEHAHYHGSTAHVHRHGHFGHFDEKGGTMHENHKHHVHGREHDHGPGDEGLKKLLLMLDHWIEHGDSHVENYREWAKMASAVGEDEIAREIHLAVDDSEAVKSHLKRAKGILTMKLVLRK